MDRRIIYPEQQAVSTDLLSVARDSMIAVGKLFEALGGSSTKVDGLACAPATGLNVSVAAGQIYQLKTIDSTAYSELGTDTHPLVKQGVRLDSSNFSTPAPGSGGQSINYLIQCRFEESDTDNTVVPYYDVDDPTVPLPGPNGDGTSQPTTRKQICAVAIKNGTAATTGAQVTPTPDAGWTGIWVVTVAFGETSVSAAKILKYTDAPFLGPKGGGRLKMSVITTSQDFIPEAGVSSYCFEVQAPGGGGCGTGGGGGGYAKKILDGILNPVPIVIGSPGVGGAVGSVAGTAGGNCSVATTSITANGGGGCPSTGLVPGIGGTASASGGVTVRGQNGFTSIYQFGNLDGGSSFYGNGQYDTVPTNGAGGCGGITTGRNGAAGFCVVTWIGA